MKIVSSFFLITKKLFSILFSEKVIFFIVVIILYIGVYGALNYNFSEAQNKQNDRYYWGHEEFPLDVTLNLSYMLEGYNGRWQAFVKTTTTLPDQKFFIKVEYLLLGHLARIFNLNILPVFYVSRFIISLFYLSTIYFVVNKIFKRRSMRILGFLLAVFSTGIILPESFNIPYPFPIFDARVLQRTTIAAHHYMLGGIFTLLSLFFLSKVLFKPKDKKSFLLAVVFGIFNSFVFAPNTVIIFSTFPLYYVYKMIKNRVKKKPISELLQSLAVLFSYTLITSLPIIYLAVMRQTLWKDNTEKLNPFSVTPVQYIIFVGLSYIFSILALPKIIKKGQTFLLLLAAWIVMHPLGEFFFSDFLSINRIRYFLTPYFVVFGILATVGIGSIGQLLSKINKKFSVVVTLVIAVGVFASGIPTYYDSHRNIFVCFCYPKYFDYSYPKKDLMQIIWWLRDNTSEEDIVLSDTFAGQLIPAFAGNRVYTSWMYRLTGLEKFVTDMHEVEQFYSLRMSDQDATNFLKRNNISYVLFGEYEKDFDKTVIGLAYSSLKKIKQVGNVKLYKVKKQTISKSLR